MRAFSPQNYAGVFLTRLNGFPGVGVEGAWCAGGRRLAEGVSLEFFETRQSFALEGQGYYLDDNGLEVCSPPFRPVQAVTAFSVSRGTCLP